MADRVTTMTVRALRATPDAGTSGPSTPVERLALVETLTREAWALAGRTLPAYARRDAPVSVRSLHDTGRPDGG